MANNKSRVNPQKRYAQNVRTYNRVQARRKKHAEQHGLKIEQLSARSWLQAPTSKASKAIS